MKRRTFVVVAGLALGCNPSSAPTPEAKPQAAPTHAGTAATTAAKAEIGKPAPDFTLKDYEGKAVHLADLKGKTVVLEWFNPGCPFVKAAHLKGSLKGLAKKHAEKGVVWL